MWIAILFVLSLLAAGTGCAGDDTSMTYSADEVLESFDAAAYPLVEHPPPAGTPAAAQGTILLPKDGADLAVNVGTDQGADEAWADYVRLGGDEDSLTVRRANVLAISDGGRRPTRRNVSARL